MGKTLADYLYSPHRPSRGVAQLYCPDLTPGRAAYINSLVILLINCVKTPPCLCNRRAEGLLHLRSIIRVATTWKNLENLEKSGNLKKPGKTWKSQGISLLVREFLDLIFYA